MGFRTLNLLSGLPLFSMKDWAIKRYYITTEYPVHFISGAVERNDARPIIWEGYQLERTSISLQSHYSNGTKLQLEYVLSRVKDILFHSLGSLSSALSAADWLLRNTKEGTPGCAITTLGENFGIEGFTISITWSWILKQWREIYKDSAMAILVGEWVTPDFLNNSNNLELKQGWDLLTFLATTDIWESMSFSVQIFTECDIQHFCRAWGR